MKPDIDYVTKENGYCYNDIGNNGYHDGLHPKGMYCDTCESVPWELGNELIQARAEIKNLEMLTDRGYDSFNLIWHDNKQLTADNAELNAERITKNDAILKYRNDIHRITVDRAELNEQLTAKAARCDELEDDNTELKKQIGRYEKVLAALSLIQAKRYMLTDEEWGTIFAPITLPGETARNRLTTPPKENKV